ncbi:hypothetical protein EYF80_036654 [Liparis tanakae]|uniref:Uncharacterized protein n=1 Tax=Liparis tanakae TaxID=230148 RepID=A0A4Z2GIR4_9TELE|nr:hypothetical protein EYF80_036654 [Liparis tanakae]
MFSMDRVLQEPARPPPELLLLLRRCPRRGERGRRGERPGLPDADPLPLDPTTSSLETERELPYMCKSKGHMDEAAACPTDFFVVVLGIGTQDIVSMSGQDIDDYRNHNDSFVLI